MHLKKFMNTCKLRGEIRKEKLHSSSHNEITTYLINISPKINSVHSLTKLKTFFAFKWLNICYSLPKPELQRPSFWALICKGYFPSCPNSRLGSIFIIIAEISHIVSF